MSSRNPEDLLWELPSREGQAELPSDASLAAYRAGQLDEAAAEALEEVLARSPGARRRLVVLAGAALEAPSPELRERILERLAPRRRSRWPAVAAAAVLTLAAVTAGWWLLRQASPVLPELRVTVAGLVETRGEPDDERAARAYPSTHVTIAAEVVTGEAAGLELAVYRVAPGELVRVVPAPSEQVTARHGRLVAVTPGAQLAGETRGDVVLLVTVAPGGEWPARLAVPAGARPADVLAAGGRRWVRAQMLRIIEP